MYLLKTGRGNITRKIVWLARWSISLMHSPRIDLLIQPQVRLRLESISKTEVLEEQADRGHLNERQKVLRMILPGDQKPVLPLHPTEEPLHDPLPLRPPKTTIRPAFEIAFDCAGAARSSPRPALAMRRPKDRCRTPCLQSGSQARPPRTPSPTTVAPASPRAGSQDACSTTAEARNDPRFAMIFTPVPALVFPTPASPPSPARTMRPRTPPCRRRDRVASFRLPNLPALA